MKIERVTSERPLTLSQQLRLHSMQWDGTDAPILIALRRAARAVAALEEIAAEAYDHGDDCGVLIEKAASALMVTES